MRCPLRNGGPLEILPFFLFLGNPGLQDFGENEIA